MALIAFLKVLNNSETVCATNFKKMQTLHFGESTPLSTSPKFALRIWRRQAGACQRPPHINPLIHPHKLAHMRGAETICCTDN